ncbi:hypothetical protein [Microvirga pakistanensis]|uniref:hypothetical protein n=1 Tax=Microvirga pakistanensis TaxID=1682650 RepID=UPI0010694910|nr:hypothetical protein [Microvirga pakistanensis]
MSAPAQHHSWTRFALWVVCSAFGSLSALLVALYLIDPYDTGRSPLSGASQLRGQKELNATASVGRNPNFTGAVIGNSTIALVMPSQLTAMTGIPFAQLAVAGSHVPEQLTVLDWFMRHHGSTTKALVFSIDRDTWCTRDPEKPGQNPFPFWRFSKSPLEYLSGLISVSSVEQAGRRLGLTRTAKAQSAADGYWDYEPLYAAQMADPRRMEKLHTRSDDQVGGLTKSFPAADVLEQKLRMLPADVSVVLVFPPVFTAKQPRPKTPRYVSEQACRRRFVELASRRPNTAVVDWWNDRRGMTGPDLFIDHIHYLHPIARALEQEIAAALQKVQRSAGVDRIN